MIIYVGTKKGTSQKGKDYQILQLAELKKARKTVTCSLKEFFVDTDWDFSDLSYGDTVKVTFDEPLEFGGYPPIKDVSQVSVSPFLAFFDDEG